MLPATSLAAAGSLLVLAAFAAPGAPVGLFFYTQVATLDAGLVATTGVHSLLVAN